MHLNDCDYFVNPLAQYRPYGESERAILSLARGREAAAEITTWPGYRETPLVWLDGLARRLGVAAVAYKDEGKRFAPGSFKALGGAYAVCRLLLDRIRAAQPGAIPVSADLISRRFAPVTEAVTVTCATDGNHGRSVAWGAQLFGCRAVIYIHETVSAGREAAIAGFGAKVVRVPGVYEDALRAADQAAAANGWAVISDTAYPGCMQTPAIVMQGYTVMVEEALRQWRQRENIPPSHSFVQAGVGGLAAAVAAHLWESLGSARPRFVVVEPVRADCAFQTAKAGRPTPASGDLDTLCAGLACGEVSLLAWEILKGGADVFLTVPDAAVATAMRTLADGADGDPPVVAGESAPAGLAGLIAAAGRPEARTALRLDRDSRVLLFGSEGATDPELFARIVGRSADTIVPAAA